MNGIQFTRLVAEIHAGGMDDDLYDFLAASMDLTRSEIHEILERAELAWEELKELSSSFCLDHPLNAVNISNQMANNGCVTGVVMVSLDELISNDLEGFLDILSNRLIGNSLLQDVQYKVLSNHEDQLLIAVTGIVDENALAVEAYDLVIHRDENEN